ncbi:MAG TPA: MarC family protein [Ignavibacteria bacterium]|nr:MarC family protein [Ignavibacteria bacterium]
MSITDLLSFTGVAFSVLFPLINPIGGVPAFSGLTAHDTPDFRKSQARKIAINVFIILITFLLIGKLLLELFGISLGVLQIAGGLIVANTGWQMVNSKADEEKQSASKVENVDISFMPMAMPILSGPGAIGAVIGMSTNAKHIEDYIGFVTGIFLIGLVTYLFLILSIPLMKKLGSTGINVLTRMMGFFILAIAVNLVYQGILALSKVH